MKCFNRLIFRNLQNGRLQIYQGYFHSCLSVYIIAAGRIIIKHQLSVQQKHVVVCIISFSLIETLLTLFSNTRGLIIIQKQAG